MLCVAGATVRGLSHATKHMPNQDAIVRFVHDGDRPLAMVAVADGHGAGRHFRSSIGAALAVNAFASTALTTVFFDPEVNPERIAAVFAAALVNRWTTGVADYHLTYPFTRAEQTYAAQRGEAGAFRSVLLTPLLAYGTTVLGTVVTPSHIVHVQIGDGDIIEVGQDGNVRRMFEAPWPILGEETDSLCMEDVATRVRVEASSRSTREFRLIMVSTDGYSKSFKTDQGFRQVASDLITMIAEHGIGHVERHMRDWLSEATSGGSGDDVTCGVIAQLPDAPPSEPSAIEQSEAQCSVVDVAARSS